MKTQLTLFLLFFSLISFLFSNCTKSSELGPHTDVHYNTLKDYLEQDWNFTKTIIDGQDSSSVFSALIIKLTYAKFQSEDINYSGMKIVDRSIIFDYIVNEKSSLFPDTNGQIKFYLTNDYVTIPYGIRSTDNMIFEFIDFEKNVNELNVIDTLSLQLHFPAEIDAQYLNFAPGESDHEHDILLRN